MKTIAVASSNPVKIQSALNGFQKVFPHETFDASGLSVPSGVNDQPMDSNETLQGATNRAESIRAARPDANFWVGIEGGIETFGDELAAFAWVYILSPGRIGKSKTASFFLPPGITELVRQGIELGQADDIVFSRSNSKQGNGAIGILTNNVIDRIKLYEPAVIMALIPFVKPDLYFPTL